MADLVAVNLDFARVRVKRPVSQFTKALIAALRRLDCPVSAFGVANFDALLRALEYVPVRARHILEERDQIPVHDPHTCFQKHTASR